MREKCATCWLCFVFLVYVAGHVCTCCFAGRGVFVVSNQDDNVCCIWFCFGVQGAVAVVQVVD